MSITTHLNRRSALGVVVALAMVLLVVGLQMAQPSEEQNEFAPSFKHVGAVGEPMEMRTGTVTVTGVRLAKSLETKGLGEEKLATTGYWLLVDFKFLPVRKSESMDMDLYSGDNVEYSASLRPSSGSAENGISGDPGFPSSGTVAYEVPKSALVNARVLIGNQSAYGIPLWDDQVVVPLGIDEKRADRLVKSAPATIVLGE